MPNCTVIAVASAKGGVGKTTTSINLGTAIAGHGLDVVVVELDLAMANVVDFLSLEFDEENDPSMHDVLAGKIPVTDALYEAPGGTTVAPSGTSLDALGSVDMRNLPEAIETLEARFDVVVLDTGAGVNSATTTSVHVADETVLVSTPRVASIRDTEKTRTIVEERGGTVGGLVLTQAGTGSSPGSDRLTEFLGVDLLCTVPQDETIHESQDAGVPVVERRPESEAARAYAAGAADLVESVITAETTETAASEPSADELLDPDFSEPEGSTDESVSADPREEGASGLSAAADDGASFDPPSKETLEAQGWTFPGAGEADVPDGSDDAAAEPPIDVAPDVDSETDVVDPRRGERSVRPLTTDGGDVKLPGEANGPASPRNVNVPTPEEQFLKEMRSVEEQVESVRGSIDELDEPDRGSGDVTDDESGPSRDVTAEGDQESEEALDEDLPGIDETDDDESDGSLSGRISSLFNRKK